MMSQFGGICAVRPPHEPSCQRLANGCYPLPGGGVIKKQTTLFGQVWGRMSSVAKPLF